ncbi:hypothetical protein RB195_009977 [Necator americanus]|uniref:DNA topoisomerase n=1 Tax=Necator americanus TaxID=51031 RepID=A0ABR1CWB0_NECAM
MRWTIHEILIVIMSVLSVNISGYLRVYPYDRWSDKTLPTYIEGEQLLDFELRIANGQTQPPELLNEADLISLMDKYGIGTDATHAEHIEKIKMRQYVGVRDDGRFIPGYLGLALVDGYDAMGYAMSKPQLRANLELQLQAICGGQRTKQEVLEEQLEKYKRIFLRSEEKVNLLSEALTRYLNMNSNLNVASASTNTSGTNVQRTGTAAPASRIVRQGTSGGRAQGVDNNFSTTTASETEGRRGRGRTRGSRANRGADPGRSAASNDSENKQCVCGIPAALRTVQKDGPNKGRKFLCCSKAMGQPDKCNFFEWVG